MNIETPISKFVSTNPLKSSAPLGAALAYLGIDGAVPLFHGSQGCTAFALVLLVRHFKETIPIQTTAMNEVSTILGGADHVEEALLNLKSRMDPRFIGICSTALTETRGEDFEGDLRTIMKKRGADMGETKVVFASTPDFDGAMETGWSKAVCATLLALLPEGRVAEVRQQHLNILAGVNMTPAEVEHIRDLVESFGFSATVLPDISGSLDGTVPDKWVPTTYGGTRVEDIARMGQSAHTLVIGEHMRSAAEIIKTRAGVPYTLFERLNSLETTDRLMVLLSQLSGRPVPQRHVRRRSQLVDAMLDGHFHFGGKRVVIGAEPDLLFALTSAFVEMGAIVTAAVATHHSPVLDRISAEHVVVGDLGDLEHYARRADLIVTHSHGRQAAHRLHIPLMRVGFPIFDRLGAAHAMRLGYEGTRDFIFEVANFFQAEEHAPTPDSLNPFAKMTEDSHDRSAVAAG